MLQAHFGGTVRDEIRNRAWNEVDGENEGEGGEETERGSKEEDIFNWIYSSLNLFLRDLLVVDAEIAVDLVEKALER